VVARGRPAVGPGLGLVLAALACKSPAPPAATPASSQPDAQPIAHCQVLRDRLCAQFGAASEVCAMATRETAGYRAERCAAMLARYDDYAASALRFAEGKRELGAREQRTPHGPAPSLGPDDAAVTLVLFCDFDDPDCGRAAPVATTVKNLHPDVRLVFRQFPLRGHAGAHLVAEASLAAHAQGKFWAFHDVLFGNPQAHDRTALERYAKLAGLDLAAFKRALDRGTFAADVDADLALGRKLGIGAVPALYRNGASVRVPYGAAELAELVAAPPKKP
jgi:hypothetical protein